MAEAGSESPIGRVLDGRYRIVGELGKGGVGVVYRAEHLQLARAMAIKLLHSEFGASQNQVRRFEREAQTLAALSHPHIVTVTDYGVTDGMPYLVMELLEGQTLQQLIKDEAPLSPDRAVDITRQTLRALAFAHGQGLVHRDLKPGNIFLQRLPDAHDHVRILDFGLAKFIVGDAADNGPALTRTGAVFGTPAYMAPEQASGDAVEASTDVYAMGVVLFEMLAGRRPFTGNMGELLRHHLLTPVPSLHEVLPNRVASPELDRFLRRALAKQRQERFQNASEMLADLDALPRPILREGGVAAASPGPDAHAPTVEGVSPATSATRPARAAGGPVGAPAPAPAPSPPSAARTPPRKGGTLLGLVGVLVGAGALGLGVWAFIALGSEAVLDTAPEVPDVGGLVRQGAGEPEPPSGEWSRTAGPGTSAEGGGAEPSAEPEGTERTETSYEDPWSEPVPPKLARLRRQALGGRAPARSVDRALRTYARQHPDDPRAHLLLAQTYLARGWRSDAVETYELAHERNPAAQADPRMLEDLIDLALEDSRRVSYKARRALEGIFGRRALPAIDERLDQDDLDADTATSLRRLRESLSS